MALLELLPKHRTSTRTYPILGLCLDLPPCVLRNQIFPGVRKGMLSVMLAPAPGDEIALRSPERIVLAMR